MPNRHLSVARAAASAALILFAGCAGSVTEPAGPQTLTALSADGLPLPAVVYCPTPEQNVEVWVAFARGTLVLRGNNTFTWQFDIGGGYRTFQVAPNGERQYLMQSATGGTRIIGGTVTRAASGEQVLTFEHPPTSESALMGEGRITTDGVTMTAYYDCPHAPDGTPPHRFTIALQ